MDINKINGIIGNYSAKTSPIKGSVNASKDEVKISKDAIIKANDKAQIEKAFTTIKNSPDIRSEEVIKAKANLEKYFENGQIKEAVVKELAEKIIDDIVF